MIALLLLTCVQSAPTITMSSLLDELTDRSALARWPSPAYTCAQASSYDRASKSPDKEKEWFANGDYGQYVRMEEHDGRTEGVMLDVDGPGAVVRIWSANPAGNLRVYIDGDAKPAIEDEMGALLGGKSTVKPPLSAITSNGYSLYAPIPYAKHCKITCDKPKDVYYQVNYRAYSVDTRIASFAKGDLERSLASLDDANSRLNRADVVRPWNLAYGVGLEHLRRQGPGAIQELNFQLQARDLALNLRRIVLHIRFDGEETVACPMGDIFGSMPGVNAFQSWPVSVVVDSGVISPTTDQHPEWGERAMVRCRWVMPYAKEFEMWCDDLGLTQAEISIGVRTSGWTWDERSMHFHARWRAEHALKTRPMRDWNHITIEGQGVFVGDALSIGNPNATWWGEGDEKFYVDREKFPSHFGTGTEDYYGYAWSSPEKFQHPLHNQTRCDGPNVFGWTSVNRFRALDAIPFTKSLRFDMEVWHWKDCEIERAATVYYYARPGAKDNAPPIRAEDLTVKQYEYKPFQIEGAIEAESLRVIASSPGLEIGPQDVDGERWSGGKHLWVRAKEKGQFVELAVPVAKPGKHEVIVYPTRSWDYGTIQFSVDGKTAGAPLVTFNTEHRAIGAPKPYSLGTFDLGSEMKLRAEVVGTHEKSEAPHYYFGIDCIVIK